VADVEDKAASMIARVLRRGCLKLREVRQLIEKIVTYTHIRRDGHRKEAHFLVSAHSRRPPLLSTMIIMV
jgi:hypothetical protein